MTVFAALFVVLFIFMILDLAQAFIPLTFRRPSGLLGRRSETHRNHPAKMNLPRIIMAILVGAGLGIAGAVMQALFRNPMASPYILGLSSGASLGAAVGLHLRRLDAAHASDSASSVRLLHGHPVPGVLDL